ncbi:MAG: hypothetical protein RI601_04140 [Desulfurivibrionaceae bacterium]|nr:hypothetical protein [Desulfurivibrionaceae bacterium]
MGLFDFLFKKKPTFERIGNIEPVCPYCSISLDKKPGRKKKCPSCGNFIYVRTSPINNQKILVTEEQTIQLEEQWAIVNGTHDDFLAQRKAFESEKESLSKSLNREPTKEEIEYSQLNNSLAKHAKNTDWGLYRNARFGMAEILHKQGNKKSALNLFLEVCYFDLNGPSNMGGLQDPEILKEYPPFNTELAMLAPGVLGRVEKIVKELNINSKEAFASFEPFAKHLHERLKLPVTPGKAWKKVEAEIWEP